MMDDLNTTPASTDEETDASQDLGVEPQEELAPTEESADEVAAE